MAVKPRVPEAPKGTSRIVPMGSFVDPNWPEASGASVNFGTDTFAALEDHPLEHGPTYGANAKARNKQFVAMVEGSEGREDWKKTDWASLAKEYGLSTSGNMDELIARVTEHEAELAEAAKEGDE